jgi:hypothetical protein
MDCSYRVSNNQHKGYKMNNSLLALLGLTPGGTTQIPGLTAASSAGAPSLYYGDLAGPEGMGYSSQTSAFDPGGIAGGYVSGTGYGDLGAFGTKLGSDSLLGGLTKDMNLGDWTGVLGGLGQLYLGFQQYGLLEDVLNENLDMAKEKWGYTKDELERIKRVRNTNDQRFMSGNYVPPVKG